MTPSPFGLLFLGLFMLLCIAVAAYAIWVNLGHRSRTTRPQNHQVKRVKQRDERDKRGWGWFGRRTSAEVPRQPTHDRPSPAAGDHGHYYRPPNGSAPYQQQQRTENAVSLGAVGSNSGQQSVAPSTPEPGAAPEPARGGAPVITAQPQRAASPPLVERALAPETAVTPRFGTGSKAAGMPWLLPMESASPPGVAADQAALGNLDVRAASVIGSGHRCQEPVTPRQDAYRVARDRNGDHLVVAVADGMSDSRRSELGAATAVGTAVALLRRHLDEGRPLDELKAAELFGQVSAAMVQAAQDRGLHADDVRATLAVAVLPAYRRAGEKSRAWVGTIADTHLWRLDATGWNCLTGKPKDSYNGSTLSEYLPHTPEAAAGRWFGFGDGDTVAVLSDGVADAFSDVAGADAWFAERWRRPPPLASFVLDVDFDARQQLDDRTAVVVWAGRQNPGGTAR